MSGSACGKIRTGVLLIAGLAVAGLMLSACTIGEAQVSPSEEAELLGPTPSLAPTIVSRATPVPRALVTATPLPPPQRPIYVLDPNQGERISRVLVIDPDSQRKVGGFSTRYLPDVAFTPDGLRLYIADTYWSRVTRGETRDVLSVYDALGGELVVDDLPIPDRLMYKVYPLGDPYLFLSREGDRLFLMKYGEPDVHQLRLTILDPESLELLHEGPWPPCERRVQVLADRWVCVNTAGGTHSPDFQTSLSLDVVDPWAGKKLETLLRVENLRGGAGIAFSPSSDRLYLVDRVMNVNVIDLSERKVLERVSLEGFEDWQLNMEAVALSPDRRHLLLGLASGEDRHRALTNQIWVYDTETWERIAVVSMPNPAMHFAFSTAGDQLYSVSPVGQSLTIYDTDTYQESATLSDLGGSPARIVVPGPGY